MARCPVCKTHCTRVTYENVPVQTCGGCGGYWVTTGKLENICRRRDIDMPEPVRQKMMDLADASNSTQQLTCFSCGTLMVKEQFKMWEDIQLDRCPKCSKIWLDRGELEKCQIYWEYLQDNYDSWEGRSAYERKALLEAEFHQRRADLEEQRESYASFRRVRPHWASLITRLLFGRWRP